MVKLMVQHDIEVSEKIPDKPVKGNYFTRFKNFLKEKFGISIPEWHSIVIGAGTALVAGPSLFAVVLTTALGLKKKAGHLYDLKKETGYGIASFLGAEYGTEAVLSLLTMI
jgi:hypothetical protein